MKRTHLSSFCPLILSVLTVLSSIARAADWSDGNGGTFDGRPIELAEPYGLFKSGNAARVVPLSVMSQDDCYRFYGEVKNHPARADTWEQATGKMTGEVVNRLLAPKDDQYVSYNFKAHAEPEFIVAVYVDSNDDRQRDMIAAALEPYEKLKKRFGDKVEGIFVGIRQSAIDHAGIARAMKMPWPITDIYRQDELHLLLRYVPEAGFSITVFTRDGDPMFSEVLANKEAVGKIFGNIYGILDAMRPENIKSWKARKYFWSAVQIKKFSSGHSDPLIVGNPLLPEGLIQRKIFALDADISVDATGKVSEAKILNPEKLDPKLVGPLGEALKIAFFAPAVDNGKFVDGVYHYHFLAPTAP